MQEFEELRPDEAVVLTFKFSLGLAPGETLIGQPVLTFATLFGGDPNPELLQNGSPQFDPTNSMVLLPVAGRMDQNNYVIDVKCLTSNPLKVLSVPAVLPVRLYPKNCGC